MEKFDKEFWGRFWGSYIGMVSDDCSLHKVSVLVSFAYLKQKREENQWVIFFFPVETECTDNFSLAN